MLPMCVCFFLNKLEWILSLGTWHCFFIMPPMAVKVQAAHERHCLELSYMPYTAPFCSIPVLTSKRVTFPRERCIRSSANISSPSHGHEVAAVPRGAVPGDAAFQTDRYRFMGPPALLVRRA